MRCEPRPGSSAPSSRRLAFLPPETKAAPKLHVVKDGDE
jgi:hypothetical protein